MYAIVIFIQSNEVEAIPVSWLNAEKNKCRWPNYRLAKAKRAIEIKEQPCHDWREYQVRVLEEIATYERAIVKVHRAIVTSNLETDAEDEFRKRRHGEDRAHSSKKSARELPSPPTFMEDSRELEDSIFVNSQENDNICSLDMSNIAFSPTKEKEIFILLNEIKEQTKQNAVMIKTLINKSNSLDNEEMFDIDLPARTEGDLMAIESMMDDQKRKKSLVLQLSELGGNSDSEVVSRIMSHIMTSELAIQFNWLGRGGKNAFSSLKLSKIVKVCARKSWNNMTDSMCEMRIKNWLKYSKDCCGGRKQRAEKSKAAASDEDETQIPEDEF